LYLCQIHSLLQGRGSGGKQYFGCIITSQFKKLKKVYPQSQQK
jgi:hypothetical protein